LNYNNNNYYYNNYNNYNNYYNNNASGHYVDKGIITKVTSR